MDTSENSGCKANQSLEIQRDMCLSQDTALGICLPGAEATGHHKMVIMKNYWSH